MREGILIALAIGEPDALIWQYLFREIVGTLSDEPVMAAVDSTHIKAHRSAQVSRGRKRGACAQAIGISRGGRNTKLHAISDMRRRPLALYITQGQRADIKGAVALAGSKTGGAWPQDTTNLPETSLPHSASLPSYASGFKQ